MPRYLILSASMGAGHDQVAAELARRFRAAGDDAEVVDLLDLLPARLGLGLRKMYDGMLALAPWSYEFVYQVFFTDRRRLSPTITPLSGLAARRLARVIRYHRPDMVVSTFHVAAQAAGRARSRGWLTVPSAVVVTDFAVHRLWLHGANDLYCCVHPAAAAYVRQHTGRPAWAPGPLVEPRFQTPATDDAERQRVRRTLGLDRPGDAPRIAVLVSTGSWGVGAIERMVAVLATSGRYAPVVLCGRNEALRERVDAVVTRAGVGVSLGWRDDVPALMHACDALVENAAGLTAMEALAAGLPVVTFRPIPGHGREGARRMAAAGLTALAGTEPELLAALDRVTTPGIDRRRLVRAGRRLFAGDAAVVLTDFLRSAFGPPQPPNTGTVPDATSMSRARNNTAPETSTRRDPRVRSIDAVFPAMIGGEVGHLSTDLSANASTTSRKAPGVAAPDTASRPPSRARNTGGQR